MIVNIARNVEKYPRLGEKDLKSVQSSIAFRLVYVETLLFAILQRPCQDFEAGN